MICTLEALDYWLYLYVAYKYMNKTSGKTPAELFAAKALSRQMEKELTTDILPFWISRMCRKEGGFHGRIDGKDNLDSEAPVGAIMTARILWTFASAYRIIRDRAYLEVALRAKEEIKTKFYDPQYGGIYWSVSPDGQPADTKKQIYAIAFAIYGLAELNRATGDAEALEYAIKLFNAIEDHSYDFEKEGYFEAFTKDWSPIEDMRLSEKDANESKTMNTHLHVLEAYTNLYRVWGSGLLRDRLRGLIEIFEKKILADDGHLRLFFDDDWNCSYNTISYGHDIEASWLIHEAALVLGDEQVRERIEKLVPKIAAAALEGFSQEEGMIYEREGHEGKCDADRHWWVQAETVVGCFNLWEHFSSQDDLENALMCWEFIKGSLIDRKGGEWFWSLRADGTVNRDDDKAGFWKCPYHNGRMCMEIIERVANLPK